MTTKERAVQVISNMPDDVSVADIIETLYVQLKVEQGLRDLKEGRTVDHSTMKERVKKWTA